MFLYPTNKDLPAEASAHRFRADLLDRLAFDVVTLPPLRARHGDVPLLGFAPRMSASSVEIRPAPRLGEHSDEVLADDLGMSAEQLAGLRGEGIIR